MSVPNWLNQQSSETARKWTIAQLAAQIAPGVVALSRSPDGADTGIGSDGIAYKSIEIAEAILSQLGLLR